MTFYVGQKVVCLRDNWNIWWEYRPVATWPRVGEVYLIRGIVDIDGSGVGLFLKEIVNPLARLMPTGLVREPSFTTETDGIANFRPVIERKTDISIFTRLLTPTDKVSA